MTSDKNLIEILNIGGNEVAVERQGIHNCMVNLTEMAKPYGKYPYDWLRSKEGKAYLAIAESMNSDARNSRIAQLKSDMRIRTTEQNAGSESDVRISHITYQPIITRKGNTSKFEQGTWCTDYHVALRFAQWLDPVFAWKLDDAIIKFLTGRNVGTLAGKSVRILPRQDETFQKLEVALRHYTSLDNLQKIARKHNVTIDHVKSVLKGNKVSNPILQAIIDVAKENKSKGLSFPDWRIRHKGIDLNQALADLFPEVIETEEKED